MANRKQRIWSYELRQTYRQKWDKEPCQEHIISIWRGFTLIKTFQTFMSQGTYRSRLVGEWLVGWLVWAYIIMYSVYPKRIGGHRIQILGKRSKKLISVDEAKLRRELPKMSKESFIRKSANIHRCLFQSLSLPITFIWPVVRQTILSL